MSYPAFFHPHEWEIEVIGAELGTLERCGPKLVLLR